MTTQEFEELVEGGSERQTVDFKAACAWEKHSFVKDIMAFANVRGGGWIVIGLKELPDNTYSREGVTDEIDRTYVQDDARDDVAPYTDPGVDFYINHVVDAAGKRFIVIRILEFTDIPIICRKDGPGLSAARIYYRNKDGRYESGPIKNSNDLREVLTRASGKVKSGLKEAGYEPISQSDKEKFDLEGRDLE